ncbi:MAG: anaerobic ribonucleoside-triphosphate reductase activating protein [Deltaproteobacteria bacterium]|nr:anaerobic ribonucleoside-triphosphate reductase activating protein [Deltaproteobacteria bacterium]
MVFGGLQKNSFVDFPGKISCVLFLAGCNFKCPFCHNPELVKRDWRLSYFNEQAVYHFLERRKGFLDGVVISGGEPTIYKGLIDLCKEIKKIGYPVKLDTNGSRPKMLKRLIDEGYVDYIAMDVKTDPFHYFPLITTDPHPDKIISSIDIIMESTITYEFRTTCARPFVDVHTIGKIANIIEGAMLYVLQPFHNTKVLQPEFFSKINPGYGDAELVCLQLIAEPWVKKCSIRV